MIFEMTGSLSQMLSLCTVSIVAYVVATLFKSEPIYESLLNRLLERRGVEVATNQERVLMEFVIRHGSLVENKRIREIPWPKDCLIVTLQRGEAELLPKGDTQLLPSDMLVLMVPSVREGNVYDEMVKLCGVDGG